MGLKLERDDRLVVYQKDFDGKLSGNPFDMSLGSLSEENFNAVSNFLNSLNNGDELQRKGEIGKSSYHIKLGDNDCKNNKLRPVFQCLITEKHPAVLNDLIEELSKQSNSDDRKLKFRLYTNSSIDIKPL